ncbi:MAG TPA: PEP/pyruvate-binding domain-containing protein [Chthoniobacterales bacterium]
MKTQPRSLFLPQTLSETDSDLPPLGGKARALLDLSRRGFTQIPGWFAVLPGASLKTRRVAPRALEEIEKALQAFPKKTLFAVRSSAIDEDGANHSFAGQLDSFLNVPRQKVIDRIERVWASGFSPRMTAYRKKHGLGKPAEPPVVLIQQMVEAEVSGVAFGADPVSGRRSVAVVSGLWGMGTALVGGEADADTWLVDRKGEILERSIARKTVAHAAASPRSTSTDGFKKVAIPEEKVALPCLDDAQIFAIAELVRATGKAFGRPQDIEWAYAGGELFLLQSRPITSLASLADPEGALQLWDNSNIAESYNGISSPLTFSFASRVYEEVYRQFCRILSVPEERILENGDTFRRMIGYVRGRIYYNLVSWYRVLALLPGFHLNRPFMEQMMGVKEGLPTEVLAGLEPPPNRPIRDGWHATKSFLSLIKSHFRLKRDIHDFYIRLDSALAAPAVPLADQRPDELAAHYRQLEKQLLTRWDAPLVNDFFAMIFHGVLRKLTAKWCGDEAGTLSNDLIAAQGNIISAEPAKRLRELANLAAADPAWVQLLQAGSYAEIERTLPAHAEFHTAYQAYLAKFAGRCLEELKLETETLDDDPLQLLRSIGRLAAAGAKTLEVVEPKPQIAAEKQAAEALHEHPIRRAVFGWVLRNARQRVSDRENLRFERTRVFGRVRQVFQEIGRRLYAERHLESPRDIFFLGIDEILGFIDGTALTTDLRSLVAVRQAEQQTFLQAPADRFETRGLVNSGHTFTSSIAAPALPTGDIIKGIGCSPGIVRGPARVILDPHHATIEPGEILIAPRTDPGWILLFPAAAGLLVEYGSLLSHSAIVSRELGLPAIVSITGLTSWVQTGDWLEMDGSKGTVRKISAP